MEFYERWLYPMDVLTPRPRKQPMAVLAVGISRSGTDSLKQALQILGHKNVYHGFETVGSRPSEYGHWALLARKKFGSLRSSGNSQPITRDDFDAIFGHCTAVTDLPAASFSMEMIEAYPEAKVILNTREIDSWHVSCVNTYGVLWAQFEFRVLPYFNPRLYWRRRGVMEAWQGYFYNDLIRNGKMKYREHCAMVRGLVPKERLLEWKIEDGWEPLCKFLDVPVPDRKFPSGNFPPEMVARVMEGSKDNVRAARQNFIIFCTLVGAGAVYLMISIMA